MRWSKFGVMIGLGPSMHLAECMRCHTLTLPGARECQNCKAAFPENCVIRKITARDVPDERVEGFVSCPGCGRLLRPGAETCPECGAAITREYAARSIEANVTVAQAYSVAERIESFKPVAYIALAASAGVLGLAVYAPEVPELIPTPLFLLVLLASSTWPLLTIMRWFRWFGSYESGDEEFAAARRKVKGALRLWLAVLAAQAAVLAASWLLR